MSETAGRLNTVYTTQSMGTREASGEVWITTKRATILLDAAYGPSTGLGHVSRMALLGSALRDIGERVGWIRRDDMPDLHPGLRWLDAPVFQHNTIPVDARAIVCDGTPQLLSEYAFPHVFAVGGSLSEIAGLSEHRLNRATAIYLQRARLSELVSPAQTVRAGGRWIIARSPADGPRDRSHVVVSFGGSEQGRAMALDVIGLLLSTGQNTLVVWPSTWGPAPRWQRSRIEFATEVKSVPELVREHARAFVGSFGITTWEVLRACVPGVYYGWTQDHLDGYAPLVDQKTVFSAGLADGYSADDLGVMLSHAEANAYEPRPFVDAHTRQSFDGIGAIRVALDIVQHIDGKGERKEGDA